MTPIPGPVVLHAALREAHSALPDAPVIDEAPRPARRPRHALARTLRSLADRLEPPRRAESTFGSTAQSTCC